MIHLLLANAIYVVVWFGVGRRVENRVRVLVVNARLRFRFETALLVLLVCRAKKYQSVVR